MSFATEDIAQLSIDEDSQVSIFLETLKENVFYLSFLVDEEIIDLPFYLYLPFASKDAVLTFEDGKTVKNERYQLYEKNYYFLCSSSGLYSLSNRP